RRLIGLVVVLRVIVHRVVPLHDEKAVLVGGAIDERDLLDDHVDEAVHAVRGALGLGDAARHAAASVSAAVSWLVGSRAGAGSGTRRAEPPIEKPVRSPFLTRSHSSSERTRTASNHVPLRTVMSPTVKSVGAR